MLTDHGTNRLLNRLRIKGDLTEHLIKVIDEGTTIEQTTGTLRAYLEKILESNRDPRQIFVYKDAVYIFTSTMVLVTAWKIIPEGRRKNAKDIRDQRLARAARLADNGPEKDRRTGPTLRTAYDSDYW